MMYPGANVLAVTLKGAISVERLLMKAATPTRETLDKAKVGRDCLTVMDVDARIRPHYLSFLSDLL